MPARDKLSPDYVWRQQNDQHTLHLGEHALVRVEPFGTAWIARTLLTCTGITPQQCIVRNVDLGKGWATRWVLQRQRLIANACERPDLAPPVVHGPARRMYAWQRPGWARAS